MIRKHGSPMGTRYAGTTEEIDALNAYIKLMRAAESVTTRVHLDIVGYLTVSQFGALEVLLHHGSLCQRELAGKLLRSPGNVTMVVDNLEHRGLVQRERDPADRRFITVHLTVKGRTLIRGLFPKVVEAVTREFAQLSPDEQHTLASLCKKLGLGRQSAKKARATVRPVPVDEAARPAVPLMT
jgi:MarR family transcriptional regulator, 2-MHQ and catechol-resistance regulon repressor